MCFVSHDWSIHQRLVSLKLWVKTVTGDEIARLVIGITSSEFRISSEQVLGIMHDCASSNNVVLQTFKVIYPTVLGIGRFSQTLNRVDKDFKLLTQSF